MKHTQILSNPSQATEFNETVFFGNVLAKLAETLEETVGLSDAEGYIAEVGESIGEDISQMYADNSSMEKEQIGRILVDLKQRIGGEFKVTEINQDNIILTNTRCPFGDRVHNKKSLCMMTTNVFGRVVSNRNGYSHVEVTDSIAENKSFCRVIVTLNSEAVKGDNGIEFFRD